MESDEFTYLSIIVEFVLIGIPLITLLISVFLIKNKILASIFLKFSFAITFGFIAYITDISFVNSDYDIYSGIIFFFFFCFVIWIWPVFIKNQFHRIILRIKLLTPIIFSLISATVGFLGVLFVVDQFKPDKEIRLNEILTYKENNTGMAFTGPHMEIYITKRLDNFGIFEKIIFNKHYESMEASYNNINVKFENDSLFLETFPDSSTWV